ALPVVFCRQLRSFHGAADAGRYYRQAGSRTCFPAAMLNALPRKARGEPGRGAALHRTVQARRIGMNTARALRRTTSVVGGLLLLGITSLGGGCATHQVDALQDENRALTEQNTRQAGELRSLKNQ